jgi:acetyl-CoA acetyltransferase
MPAADVVILSAARTPIGRYGGSFKDLHPAELGAVASRAAIERAGIAPADIDEVLMGHGRQAGSGPNPARQVGHRAGVPHAVPDRFDRRAGDAGWATSRSSTRCTATASSVRCRT